MATMTEKLNEDERKGALPELIAAGWNLHNTRDAIEKKYVFKNFVEAFGWMTKVSLWAEKWDHHPEWANVYRNVEVILTTHEVDGLTHKDVKLARKMDALAG